MIFFFLFFIMFCVLESLYCWVRKKHKINNTDSKNSDNEQKRSILINVVVLANDITFLFCKLVGYLPSHFVRMFFYKYIFHMSIADKVVIYYGLEVRSPWNVVIGENSIIGDKSVFDARYGITIGKNVNLSTGVWIWTLQHDVNSSSFDTRGQEGNVVINDRAWVSSRTTLLPNTIIGEGAVIAAGAVVTGKQTIEPYKIYGGIPAKYISKRNDNLNYSFDGKHRLFF